MGISLFATGISPPGIAVHPVPLYSSVRFWKAGTCPPKATADSGIDALTHAIEAYMATDSSDLELPADSAAVPPVGGGLGVSNF